MGQFNVHKFGGTSLSTAEKIRSVKNKISKKNQIVVVSAISNTTTLLDESVNLAAKGEDYSATISEIKSNHLSIIHDLFPVNEQTLLIAQIQIDLNKIEELLEILTQFSVDTFEIREIILGYGEQWSAQILTSFLNQNFPTQYISSYDFLTLDDPKTKNVLWEKSKEKIDSCDLSKNTVITGYIAASKSGKLTTLGRNGSDYSASIIANLVNAQTLTIWTDVNGVLSADPTVVPSAFPLEHLSYNEALELAYFGASVIHPKTMMPVIEKEIPVRIKNSSNVAHQGTLINSEVDHTKEIKGITSIKNISLITVEGSGMIGVSGIAARVFQTMKNIDVSVVLITQSSSEHSICFAIKTESSEKSIQELRKHFQFELEKKLIQHIRSENNCSIIAIVGDTMVGRLGVLEKVSGSLAKASVNIKAVAQGSSERNISLIVSQEELSKALRAIHSGFHLSKKTVSIGIIGTGLIGKELIHQLHTESEKLASEFDVDLRVRGLMNSKKMILDDNTLNLDTWESDLNKMGNNAVLNEFIDHIKSDNIPHSLVIDCTASAEVASKYVEFLKNGLHIITPNKKAHSSNLSFYNTLKSTSQKNKLHFLYETTVGAGLPVIRTLDDLIQTGDKVLQIEGVFSGTLAYLFDKFDGNTPFSKIVIEAKAKGFTEPDPRDDLSGMDVARKVVILARQMGLNVSLSDLEVESLVPKELEKCSTEEFLQQLQRMIT